MKFKLFTVFSFIIVSKLIAVPLIATGGKGGTYYPFGKEIAQVCGNEIDGKLDALPTSGSLDNIDKLLLNPNVKFAIVQQDALEYYLNSKNLTPKQKARVKELRVVMPLYNEEVHLVVRKDLQNINSLNDLSNLRVSIGKEKSGTYVTAKNFARIGGITWRTTYAADIQTSLKAIFEKKLDAAFYVAGAPAKIFNRKQGEPIFSDYRENLKLVDTTTISKLKNKYAESILRYTDYAWLDADVKTLAVPSVLITYNYKPYQPSYKRVKKLYQCIYNNIDKLKGKGFHPKWSEVDPTEFRNISWPIHPAVNEVRNELSGKIEQKNSTSSINNSSNNESLKRLDDFFKTLN